LLSIFFSNAGLLADTYYVSPIGSNRNSGSIQQPWQTIMHAVRNTVPGDTILLRGGKYPKEEDIWIRSKYGQGGEIGKWKTIKSFPGDIVYLSQ
jgi:hypothetical protein